MKEKALFDLLSTHLSMVLHYCRNPKFGFRVVHVLIYHMTRQLVYDDSNKNKK